MIPVEMVMPGIIPTTKPTKTPMHVEINGRKLLAWLRPESASGLMRRTPPITRVAKRPRTRVGTRGKAPP